MPKAVPKSELMNLAGWKSKPSEWFEIDQQRINGFADATEDHQYIHIDPERAAATPFGGTVAHGFLTLSLLPRLIDGITVAPEGTVMAINYGLNRVRFLQPVPAGSRVRAQLEISDVQEKDPNRFLITAKVAIEIEGQAKPALIAESLLLYLTA